jgi:hypothetical protein
LSTVLDSRDHTTVELALASIWLKIVWRSRLLIGASALAGALAGLSGAAAFPRAYDAEAEVRVTPFRDGESRVPVAFDVMRTSAGEDVVRQLALNREPHRITTESLVRDHLILANPRGHIVLITARMPTAALAVDVANRVIDATLRDLNRLAALDASRKLDALAIKLEGVQRHLATTTDALRALLSVQGPAWAPEVPAFPTGERMRLREVLAGIQREGPTGDAALRLGELTSARDTLLQGILDRPVVRPADLAAVQALHRVATAYDLASRDHSETLAEMRAVAAAGSAPTLHVLVRAEARAVTATPQQGLAALGGSGLGIVLALLSLSLFRFGGALDRFRVRSL